MAGDTGMEIQFFMIFSAVLGANLLTVAFVWACVQISQIEHGGGTPSQRHIYFRVLLMVLAFFGGTFWLTMAS